MKSLRNIELTLQDHKQYLFSTYHIKSLAIFGSFARNMHNEQSDLDLLVEFNDKVGLNFIDLAEELENIIGLKIDLVSRKGIKDKYFKKIESNLTYV